jgi:hypothetical protein
MCVRFEGLPALVPGSVRFQRAPLLLLYKVVAGGTGGEHVSSRGMAYPLGRPVLDPAAEFGAHERCIHLVPTETDARSGSMASYGSHVLAMLAPVGRVWTTPGGPDAGRAACWHTDRCVAIWCATCEEGIARPTVVTPPGPPPLVLPAPTAASWDDLLDRRHAARLADRLVGEAPLRRLPVLPGRGRLAAPSEPLLVGAGPATADGRPPDG